ncbi:MAG: GNAT family N-acetyltransferase [Methanomassiliicoccales archaeon]
MKSLVNVVPAEENIEPFLKSYKEAVSATGENIPDSWVEDRIHNISTGSEFCLGLCDDTALQGILHYSFMQNRAFALISWGSTPPAEEDIALLLNGFQERTPPAMTLRLGGIHPGISDDIFIQAATKCGFSYRRRFEMELKLPVKMEAAQPPAGLEVTPLTHFDDATLSVLDWKAFEGTVDEKLMADTEEENRALMHSLLSGDYGPVIVNASLCLCEDSVPVAMIAVTDMGETAFIADLAVTPTHKGKGLGKYLVSNAIVKCNELKKSGITLWVSEGNTSAYSLYKSLSFGVRRTGSFFVRTGKGV